MTDKGIEQWLAPLLAQDAALYDSFYKTADVPRYGRPAFIAKAAELDEAIKEALDAQLAARTEPLRKVAPRWDQATLHANQAGLPPVTGRGVVHLGRTPEGRGLGRTGEVQA